MMGFLVIYFNFFFQNDRRIEELPIPQNIPITNNIIMPIQKHKDMYPTRNLINISLLRKTSHSLLPEPCHSSSSAPPPAPGVPCTCSPPNHTKSYQSRHSNRRP